MPHHIVTECPACTTRFQVTSGQLRIAGGKVRCGSCLEVFNAEVYRCDDLPETEPGLTPGDSGQNNQSHKDPLFDQIEVPAFVPPPRNTTLIDKRYNEPAVDEILAQQFNSEAPDPEPESENEADDSEIAEPYPVEPEDPEQEDLEQPVQEIIAEQQQPDNPTSVQTETDTETLIAELPSITEPVSHSIGSEQTDDNQIQSAQNTREAAPVSMRPETEEEVIASQPFTRFQTEPVMIKTTREAQHRSSGWAAMCLVALFLLAAQYLWFNRQQLSTYPELSGLYTQACNYLPCNLSAPIQLSEISTRHLVVAEHKAYQGALTVNLLLENRARFGQPFPAIELSFSDRKGQLISQRLFQPGDYLQQGLTPDTRMPIAQPVQISFDILDPGRRAVSYEAILRKPERQLHARLKDS